MPQKTTNLPVASAPGVGPAEETARVEEELQSASEPSYYRVVMHLQAKNQPQSQGLNQQSWLCVPSFPSYHGAKQYMQRKQTDGAEHPLASWEIQFEILSPEQPFVGEKSLLIRPVEPVYTQDHRIQIWVNLFVCTDTDQIAWCEDPAGVSYVAAQIPWPDLSEQDWIWRIVCSYPTAMTRSRFAMLGGQ